MRSFWIVAEESSHGVLTAEDEVEADKQLFLGICQNKYPLNATLVELVSEEDIEITDVDILMGEVELVDCIDDADIISVEPHPSRLGEVK